MKYYWQLNSVTQKGHRLVTLTAPSDVSSNIHVALPEAALEHDLLPHADRGLPTRHLCEMEE
jgi:hypothetical protein